MVVSGRHCQADQTRCPDSGTKVWPCARKGAAGGSCPGGHSTAADLPASKHAPTGYPHQQRGDRSWSWVFLCLGMCLFLLDRCSVFVSKGFHSFCSGFQCPRTLSNTKLHEYFHWHERVPPSVSDTGSPARNYLHFCSAGTR